MVSSKHIFWQALIFTILIFGIGLIFGYFLESSRADKSQFSLMTSEINLLDDQIRSELIGKSNISCELAVKSTFAFADKIYEDALQLEKFDAVSKFNRDNLLMLHKRYDLLRMMLWEEAITLKKRCGGFHTVVYFFNYDPQDVEMRARQAFFSRLLVDVKNDYPDKVLLIPVAGNVDLASVELAMESYSLDSPSILVDEKIKFDEVVTLEEVESSMALNKTKSFS